MSYTDSLHSIVTRVVGDSRVKLAQEVPAEEKKPSLPPKAEEKKKEEEKKDEAEKTASFASDLLKLASACDFMADNLGGIVDDRPDSVKLAEAMELVAHMQKIAVGGPAISDAGNAPASLDVPKKPPQGEGATPGPANAMQNDLKKVPGGTGTQPYKKDGKPMETGGTNEKALPTESASSMTTDANAAPGGNSGSVPTKAYPEAGVIKQAGVPSRFAGAMAKQAGGSSVYDFIKTKLAENANNPAKNQASGDMGQTVVDGGSDPGTAAGENVPPQPKQNEGSLRALVTGSPQKVIDFKPRDTVAPVKKRLAEVLDTPAQAKSLDSKLQENLTATDEAGTKLSAARKVKIAAGRALLKQIADGHYGEEGIQLLKTAAKRKLAEEGVQPTGEAVSSDTGEEDADTTKKEKKEKALQNLLQTAAREKGEKKEE